jgi:prepilin-type N-terminal cleavage/methylation domain-containing protein
MFRRLTKAVTLLELIVVVLILSVLATIATPVFIGQVTRAKVAATRDTIRQLEVAIARYEIDVGVLPPSFTGSANTGNGWLTEALLHSTGGNINSPSDPRWNGPYIEFDSDQLRAPGTVTANNVSVPDIREYELLDAFESPYNYVRFYDYSSRNGTELPTSSPFYTTETYYNPRTLQIWSGGPDMTTNFAAGFAGTDPDDITNF